MIRRVVALAGLLVVGCSAEAPGVARWDGGTPAQLDQMLPDGLAGCPAPSTLTVTLDPNTPGSTCHATQPFRGTAPGADRVVVLGGAGAAQPALVNADGSFCIEVPLDTDSLNALTFSAVDAGGCPGQGLERTIKHGSCNQPDTTASAAVNAALGATVISGSPSEGDRIYLVDGKLDTVVKYKGGGWGFDDANVKIDIALSKTVEVERIILRWDDKDGDGCNYGKEYKLLSATAVDPGKVGDGSWVEIEEVKGGDGGEDAFDLPSKPQLRHVGLELDNNGCSSWSETFALREVEVWARDPAAAAPLPDRCM